MFSLILAHLFCFGLAAAYLRRGGFAAAASAAEEQLYGFLSSSPIVLSVQIQLELSIVGALKVLVLTPVLGILAILVLIARVTSVVLFAAASLR